MRVKLTLACVGLGFQNQKISLLTVSEMTLDQSVDLDINQGQLKSSQFYPHIEPESVMSQNR